MSRRWLTVLLLIMSVSIASCSGEEQSAQATSTVVQSTATLPLTKIVLDLAGDEVRSVAFFPDGSRLVTGAWGSLEDTAVFDEIRIWDTATGDELDSFSERGEAVLAVAFSPDGRWLAAGLVDDSDNVAIWDVASGKMIAVLEGHSTWVTSVAFSPDSGLLASGSNDTLGKPTVRIWDVATFELITTLEGVNQTVNSLVFSPDGKYLAAGLDDGVIQLWNSSTFDVETTLFADVGDVFALTFSPDGNSLAAGVQFATVQLWDVKEEKVLWTQDYGSYARAVAFSSDGMLLAAGLEDGTVLVWDSFRRELVSTLEGHEWRVNSVAFSPSGDRLASGSDDSTVVLWPMLEISAGIAALLDAPPIATDAPQIPATSTATVPRATTTLEDLPNVRIDAFGVPMVFIPGGAYQIGGDPAQSLENCLKYREDCLLEWFEDESPLHQVELEDFMIDQFEVTNVLYAECVDVGVCEPPDLASSATRTSYYGNPGYEKFPVIYASWEDADVYCSWRGGRLPTEAEWEVAARAGRNPYPWGNNDPVCSPGSPYGAKFDDENVCNDTDTEAVGNYHPNDFEIYDMAGNVMEWTADWYDAYPGNTITSDEYGQTFRVARGGSWFTFGNAIRANVRFPVLPASSFNSYGIRCASEPFESQGTPQSISGNQDQLKDEWRPAIGNAILLSTTCQLMFETHFNYGQGDLNLDQALSQLSAEGDYVSFTVRGLSSGPVPSGDVAPYILELEGQSRNLIELLPPLDNSRIGSTQALDTLDSTCGALFNLLNDIVEASKGDGLSDDSVEELDLEISPMINDLYNTVLGD